MLLILYRITYRWLGVDPPHALLWPCRWAAAVFSRDPPGSLSSHDLGPSRDGVWEVFSSGLASSMCNKKEANEPL